MLYEVSFVLLSLGWVVLFGALLVFIIGKVCYSIVCCKLCRYKHKDLVFINFRPDIRYYCRIKEGSAGLIRQDIRHSAISG